MKKFFLNNEMHEKTRKFSYYYRPKSSFLGKIFYGRWTGTGMDTMDGMDKNGLLNGQWTMDNGQWTMDDGQRLCRAFQG